MSLSLSLSSFSTPVLFLKLDGTKTSLVHWDYGGVLMVQSVVSIGGADLVLASRISILLVHWDYGTLLFTFQRYNSQLGLCLVHWDWCGSRISILLVHLDYEALLSTFQRYSKKT